MPRDKSRKEKALGGRTPEGFTEIGAGRWSGGGDSNPRPLPWQEAPRGWGYFADCPLSSLFGLPRNPLRDSALSGVIIHQLTASTFAPGRAAFRRLPRKTGLTRSCCRISGRGVSRSPRLPAPARRSRPAALPARSRCDVGGAPGRGSCRLDPVGDSSLSGAPQISGAQAHPVGRGREGAGPAGAVASISGVPSTVEPCGPAGGSGAAAQARREIARSRPSRSRARSRASRWSGSRPRASVKARTSQGVGIRRWRRSRDSSR